MLKDYKTLEKAQHFIEDAGLPGAVNDFLAMNGERLGIKNRVAFMNILHGRKFYSDVHGLFTEFVRFYLSRLDVYRGAPNEYTNVGNTRVPNEETGVSNE